MGLDNVLRNMGVVGAGGAGFPTDIKVKYHCDIVIGNGAECEPLLYNDKHVMKKEAEKVIRGLEWVIQSTGAKKGVIALKKKNTSIIENMEKVITGKSNISLYFLEDYYPIGDEFLLVEEISGKIIPEGGLPLDVGCLVSNVETLKNIDEATKGNPVISRTLTCNGALRKPAVILAKIGQSIREIVDICEPAVKDFAIIVGGPMMGEVENDLDSPVTKTMTGIIVLPRDHALILRKTMRIEFIVKQSKTACCQCSYCTDLCPRYLLGHELYPHKIMRQINLNIDIPYQVIQNAFLCSECGLCEVFACPMNLSPRIINQKIKEKLTEEDYQPKFLNGELKKRDMFEYRKIPSQRIEDRLMLNKYKMNEKKLVTIPVINPDRVEILLKQHAGVPSKPIIKIGEQVKEGDLIADIPEGQLGARLHASIEGKAIYIDDERIIIKK